MTKGDFIEMVDKTLSISECALVSTNILYNPAHVDYYTKYRLEEDYEWCYQFLVNNRHLLTLEHTPEQFKSVAMAQLRIVRDSRPRMFGSYRKKSKK